LLLLLRLLQLRVERHRGVEQEHHALRHRHRLDDAGVKPEHADALVSDHRDDVAARQLDAVAEERGDEGAIRATHVPPP
jgi:hypothetical protein